MAQQPHLGDRVRAKHRNRQGRVTWISTRTGRGARFYGVVWDDQTKLLNGTPNISFVDSHEVLILSNRKAAS